MTTPSSAERNGSSLATEEFEVLLISDEGEPGYGIMCPTLPGCNSQGEDWDDALSMMKEAIGLFLEVAPRPVVPDDAKQRLMEECLADGFRVDVAWVSVTV